MGKEIERKFLIDISKIESPGSGSHIKQGYISTTDNTAVRVRVKGDIAYLTLKGENKGATRSEFEYESPLQDANEIIEELCSGPVIDKTRYLVENGSHTWEVDVFHGDNDGLIVAEVELESETEAFDLPSWVASEVTGQVKYYNSSLLDNPFSNWSKKDL
jgi:adenylate cyclase